MTDRELLELAAKAAGHKIEFKRWSGMMRTGLLSWRGSWTSGERTFVGGVEWNPLTDDADALRLAVKLDICVMPRNAKSFALGWQAVEAEGSDPYAATRRAIVRAAAEIGESMP